MHRLSEADLVPGQRVERYFCSICSELFHDPVFAEGKCQCVFCRACIMESLKARPECPLCQTKVAAKFLNVHRWVANTLDELRVVCPNNCTWTGTYENRKAHLEICPVVKIDKERHDLEQRMEAIVQKEADLREYVVHLEEEKARLSRRLARERRDPVPTAVPVQPQEKPEPKPKAPAPPEPATSRLVAPQSASSTSQGKPKPKPEAPAAPKPAASQLAASQSSSSTSQEKPKPQPEAPAAPKPAASQLVASQSSSSTSQAVASQVKPEPKPEAPAAPQPATSKLVASQSSSSTSQEKPKPMPEAPAAPKPAASQLVVSQSSSSTSQAVPSQTIEQLLSKLSANLEEQKVLERMERFRNTIEDFYQFDEVLAARWIFTKGKLQVLAARRLGQDTWAPPGEELPSEEEIKATLISLRIQKTYMDCKSPPLRPKVASIMATESEESRREPLIELPLRFLGILAEVRESDGTGQTFTQIEDEKMIGAANVAVEQISRGHKKDIHLSSYGGRATKTVEIAQSLFMELMHQTDIKRRMRDGSIRDPSDPLFESILPFAQEDFAAAAAGKGGTRQSRGERSDGCGQQ